MRISRRQFLESSVAAGHRRGHCRDTPHPTRTHFCVQCHVGQNLAVGPFEKTRTK